MARLASREEELAALEALARLREGEQAEVTAAALDAIARECRRQERQPEEYMNFDWREQHVHSNGKS